MIVKSPYLTCATIMDQSRRARPDENAAAATASTSTTEWGRRATLHVGTFNHKPVAQPSKRRRFSEDLLQNTIRPRPISGIAARCRAWTMRFHRNSSVAKDDDSGKWKTSPCASSLAINMSLLVGTADVLSDIAERAFFTALQTNDVDEVSLAIDRYGHILPFFEKRFEPLGIETHKVNRRDSIQTEILLRNCEHLLEKYEEGEAAFSVTDESVSMFQNALHTAVYYESTDVVEVLLSRGFDPNVIGEIQDVNRHSKERESVLRFIVPPSLSGYDTTDAMVDDFWIKRPAIFLAAHIGNHDILRKLLNYGAAVNVTDENGDCPLHFIVGNLMQNVRCVSLLLEQGVSLYHRNKDGKTPLDLNSELRHLYKRIVLDHLEPLSPDSSSTPSEEMIFKRRLRSIGGTSSGNRKQSIGALTLSKLRLKKTGQKNDAKSIQREELEQERQDQKRVSVGRKMSFAFRSLFEKRKKSHLEDLIDVEGGETFLPSQRSKGETSRGIGRRRCISFNDKVGEFFSLLRLPNDQNIFGLKYYDGTQEREKNEDRIVLR